MRLAVVCRLLVVSALLALLMAASTAAAFEQPPGAQSAQATGSKKKKCKGAKVPVTVGRKTTCQPLAKAIPKPKAIDLRLAHLKDVLKFDPARAVHGKKRKRARTLQSGFGAAGKRAQKKLLKVLPKALAFIDRKKKVRARSSRLAAAPAFISAGCGPGPAGPTGQTGGATVGTLGDNGGYIDAPAGGGVRVRITFYSCGGTGSFHGIPECPAADGSVDAKSSGQFNATIEIWEGSRLVSRNSSVFEDDSKAHGKVGADAKLKFIDVEHTQEVFIIASGGIAVRGGVTRKVRIEMPGGKYDADNTSVAFFRDKVSDDGGASAFAGIVNTAITAYKNAEPHWSSFPPNCAEPVFSPKSNTLKLRKGEQKQLAIYAKAKDGGQATEARWTLLSPENAKFSPTTSPDAAPNISYTVTNAPKGGQVKVTVKFTSTAGVGEKTWTQPTEPGINHISGTFMEREEERGSTYEWVGKADFERSMEAFMGGADGQYKLASGTFTGTASGSAAALGLESCSQSGSGQFAVSASDSGFLVLLRAAETDPYLYTFTINPSDVTEHYKIQIFECPEPYEEGPNEIPVTFTVSPLTLQNSADGIDYSGSETIEEGEKTITREWSFHGTE